MSFIASLATSAIEAGLIGAGIGTASTVGASAGLLGAGATSALAGTLGGGLAGAGIGALGSAVTGGDPGQGALMGGVTGGVLGGLGGLGNALNAGESAAQNVATTASNAPNATPIANSSSGILSNNTALGAAQNMAQSSPINLIGSSAPEGITSTLNTAPTALSGADKAFNAATSAGQFSNALGPVGDLAQGYANMGTLGKTGVALGTGLAANSLLPSSAPTTPTTPTQKSNFSYTGPSYSYNPSNFAPYDVTKNRNMFPIYQPTYMAEGGVTPATESSGGIAGLTESGMYPQSQQDVAQYATPTQMPTSAQVVNADYDTPTNPYTGDELQMAQGGIADLGGYSKGGNLLAGGGDGVSDDIPATIEGKQPARLASGEYVIPSRIVSELGNGSTDAGAKRLDMMVQKVNAGRAKTLKGKSYAKDTAAYKHLPA